MDRSGFRMKPSREFAALLRCLKANGVTSYTKKANGDVSIQFGDASRPQLEATSASPGDDQEPPLDLPDGVPDPVAYLKKINAKRQDKSS